MQIDRAFGDPRPACDVFQPRRRKASRGKFIKGNRQDRFSARSGLLRAAGITPPRQNMVHRRLEPMLHVRPSTMLPSDHLWLHDWPVSHKLGSIAGFASRWAPRRVSKLDKTSIA